MSAYSHKNYRPKFKKGNMDNSQEGCRNYSTGLVHAILCGASGWAIHQTSSEETPIALGCFVFLLGHGLIGILKHTHPIVCDTVDTIYKHTTNIALCTPLALINGQFHMKLDQPISYSYGLLTAGILPPVIDMFLEDNQDMVADMVEVSNLGMLSYLAAVKEKYWAVGAAVLHGFNFFALDSIAERFDVPKDDLFTIGLSFFAVFAVNCLAEE